MRRGVVYVISEVVDAPSFAWIAERAAAEDWRAVFVLMNQGHSRLETQLRELGVTTIHLPYRGRKDIFRSFLSLCGIFRRLRPRAVHTHLLAANLAGLLAAWLLRVPVRIYTRHHSNIHQDAPLRVRFYDFLPNLLSTTIVATCRNVQDYLVRAERVDAGKIKLVHLGFELDAFEKVSEERVNLVRARYGFQGRAPVVGLISRYTAFKGVPYAIEAFRDLLKSYPEACLVLANAGQGEAAAEIRAALSDLPPASYREIPFESDAPALLRSFDVFVHVPVDEICEAFGQVYVEAMLSEVPSVVTLSGVAREIVRHRENSLVVPFRNAAAIRDGILEILREPAFGRKLAAVGVSEARELFPVSKMIDGLRELYR